MICSFVVSDLSLIPLECGTSLFSDSDVCPLEYGSSLFSDGDVCLGE